jgi:hypothetical protein
MTIVPLTVLVLIVIYIVGGPVAFVSTISDWGAELFDGIVRWIKYL